MISSLPTPQWSQRDPQWRDVPLGTGSQTIGQIGCLITSISMANSGFDNGAPSTPGAVNAVFTNGGAYADQNLVIWNAINRLLPNMSTQGQVNCFSNPAPVAEIMGRLDQGQLAILQVGFGGNPGNMHFVLAVGYTTGINGTADIIFHDPWYGDRSQFSSRRYGTGIAEKDILVVHYFADGAPDLVKPQTPVAARPSTQPLLPYQRQVVGAGTAYLVDSPHVAANTLKTFGADSILDFKGFVTNGEVVEGTGIWFVGRYSNAYMHSSALRDWSTHDLPDLTPPPVTAEVVVAPEPEPEKVAEVLPEYETSWVATDISDKVVAVPLAYVYNVELDKKVADLTGGQPVNKLAGYFDYKGNRYFRTQWSVNQYKKAQETGTSQPGMWNGILESEVKDAEIQIPVIVVKPQPPVDGISGKVDTGSVLDIPGHTEPPTTEHQVELIQIVLGYLLSPLRLVGKLFKKGSKK